MGEGNRYSNAALGGTSYSGVSPVSQSGSGGYIPSVGLPSYGG
jgi:hypothetical protein